MVSQAHYVIILNSPGVLVAEIKGTALPNEIWRASIGRVGLMYTCVGKREEIMAL
jgi:hypothetical protein